jgi:hypothetical protein
VCKAGCKSIVALINSVVVELPNKAMIISFLIPKQSGMLMALTSTGNITINLN